MGLSFSLGERVCVYISHHLTHRNIRHKGFGKRESTFRDAGKYALDEASCISHNEAKMLLAQPQYRVRCEENDHLARPILEVIVVQWPWPRMLI